MSLSKRWNKKAVPPETVRFIGKTYNCDLLTASILCRRGVTSGSDILFYLEDDLRYEHSPFLFADMEDAVDRILQAQDEGEKVLVFGDRDADGITSTALITGYLQSLKIDVSWKVPEGDEPYGLTMRAVDDFAASYGTLIITVDCGISCQAEIEYAASLGIDVIVVDHHNPPENPPDAVILDPKIPGCGYPFQDISGCAVAYKLVSALRFSRSEIYKQEICLLNVVPLTDSFTVTCLKIVNGCIKAKLSETLVPKLLTIDKTRLPDFLRAQQIFVWDGDLQKKQLKEIFGANIDFNMLDIKGEIEKYIPSVRGASLLKIKDMSRIFRYKNDVNLAENAADSEMEAFYNIFISYIRAQTKTADNSDLQLTAIAALADIMPMQNENRIFVRQALKEFNAGKIRAGLKELFLLAGFSGKTISSIDISWKINPVINAAGRLGKSAKAVKLLLSDDAVEREHLAKELIALNEERKKLGETGWEYISQRTFSSLEKYNGKFVFAFDERIHRGITGILASRANKTHNVPSIICTELGEEGKRIVQGSARSSRGFDVTALLTQFSDILIAFGGHDYAAGFSFEKKYFDEFVARLKKYVQSIALDDKQSEHDIDAELPPEYMSPELLHLVDRFEPYGSLSDELYFRASAKIIDAMLMGKGEKKILKLTVQCGSYKWPALHWDGAERLGIDFEKNDTVNIIFRVKRNFFNGTETAQLEIEDLEKIK